MGKIAKVTEVAGAKSIDDMLQQSGTDWDIEVVEAGGPYGRDVHSGGFKALVRPDTQTALAFVGERFRANSHRKQLHTLDGMVTNGDILPVSVSLWDNGAILAYQFRCPSVDVVILGQDVVSPLLTLAFAYGSQLADSAFFSEFRWFCKNQMGQVAQLNKDSKVKHRGDIQSRFGDILGARLSELNGELSDRHRLMQGMTTKALPMGRSLHNYFGEVAGCTKEQSELAWVTPAEDLRGNAAHIPEILECYQEDNAGAEGTVWHAYNAVTRYETHKAGRSAESRHRRMLLGTGNQVVANAWDLAVAL